MRSTNTNKDNYLRSERTRSDDETDAELIERIRNKNSERMEAEE